MKDLTTLAVKHNIENQLYYSGSIHKIYQLLGENRVTKWLMKISDEDFSDEEQWQKLIQFLEKELRVQEFKTNSILRMSRFCNDDTKRPIHSNQE